MQQCLFFLRGDDSRRLTYCPRCSSFREKNVYDTPPIELFFLESGGGALCSGTPYVTPFFRENALDVCV